MAMENRRATLARLQRVNRALQELEEWECAQIMSEDIRPEMRKPVLGRGSLESLQSMLETALKETEQMWLRRN